MTAARHYDLEHEVRRFRIAKHTHETARLGSVAETEAERTMQRIVDRAEASGNLQALLHALHH